MNDFYYDNVYTFHQVISQHCSNIMLYTQICISHIRIKLFLMFVFPFVRISAWINNNAEIRTKGNANIKNSLIWICDTDKKRIDIVDNPSDKIYA